MSTLPLQGAASLKEWSLARDAQFRTELENGLDAYLSRGFLSGGVVTQTAALEIQLAFGSVVWTAGIRYTLPANQLYSGFSNGTIRVWGLLTRTAADQEDPLATDTYSFVLTHTTNDPAAPSAWHIPVKTLTVVGGTITVLTEPAGKFCHPGSQRGWQSISIAGTGNYTLGAAELRDSLLKLTGVLTGARSVLFPLEAGRLYLVYNATSGAFSVTAKISGGTGGPIPQGEHRLVYLDSADVVVVNPADFGMAPKDAQFLVLSLNPTLTAERVLVAGAALALTDGGAGGNATLDVNVDNATLEVNADALRVKASGIQDSHLATPYSKADGTRPFTGDQSLGSHKLTNVTDPSAAQDAATKAYVDAVASGLDVKASCRAASTGNLTLSGTQTIDGVACIAGDRVLVKDQGTASQNGVYAVASGAWTRATDADSNAEVTSGLFTFIEEGTVNAGTGWVLTTANPITVGSTGLSFTQFSGAGEITAGTGLTKAGNTLNVVANADGSLVANADDIQVGVLATDGQHGSRGGGSLHAGAVAGGAAGFLSGADKSKLDGVAAGAPALGLIVFGAQGALPSALTRYLAPGSGNVSINEIKVRLLVACTAQLLAVRTSAAPGTGVSDVVTVRKNGADTALTATLADTNTEAEDTGHTVAFAAGDDLSVKLVSGTLTASQDMMVSLVLK